MPPGPAVIDVLDEISDTVCQGVQVAVEMPNQGECHASSARLIRPLPYLLSQQVLDPAELCRNVAASGEWRAAATRVCIDMEGYVQVLYDCAAHYGCISYL
eukprot:scaffold429000_cov40-Prasinocladus_malaysianus.AAC.1